MSPEKMLHQVVQKLNEATYRGDECALKPDVMLAIGCHLPCAFTEI